MKLPPHTCPASWSGTFRQIDGWSSSLPPYTVGQCVRSGTPDRRSLSASSADKRSPLELSFRIFSAASRRVPCPDRSLSSTAFKLSSTVLASCLSAHHMYEREKRFAVCVQLPIFSVGTNVQKVWREPYPERPTISTSFPLSNKRTSLPLQDKKLRRQESPRCTCGSHSRLSGQRGRSAGDMFRLYHDASIRIRSS